MRFPSFFPKGSKLTVTILVLATVFLTSFWSINCNAATDVIGFISSKTTWIAANSPYVTKGNILVKEGVTLIIEPGVTVRFNPEHSLTIRGTLIAKGTKEQDIKFTANQSATPGAWDGIVFEDSSEGAKFDGTGNYISGSILQYCTVEFAKKAIEVNSAPPFIDRCIVSNSALEGIYISKGDIVVIQDSTITNNRKGILAFYTRSVRLVRNTFSENKEEGIYIGKGDTVVMRDNTIADNARGIRVEYTKNVTITGNILTRSKGWGGAYIYEGGDTTISNNTFTGNKAKHETWNRDVSSSGGGLYIYSSTATVSNNTFTQNTVETKSDLGDARSYGGGIYIKSSTATIDNNTFTGNEVKGETGPHHFCDASSYGGGVYIESSTTTVSNNTFTGNKAEARRRFGHSYGYGGGIACDGGVITDNRFTENLGSHGSAIYYSGNQEITGNLITNNLAEETAKTTAVYIKGSPTFAQNTIGDNYTEFDLYYDQPKGSPDLDASNNYWGVTTEAEIRLRIGDFFTGAGRGRVNVVPFLKSAPTNFVTAEEQINLSYSVDKFIPESATGTAFSLPVVKSPEYQAYFPWIASHVDTAWSIILPMTFKVTDSGGTPISDAQIFMGEQRLGVTDSSGKFTHNYVVRVARIPEGENEVIKLPFSGKKNGVSTTIDIPFSWSIVERTSIHIASKEDYDRYTEVLYKYEFFESKLPLPKELTFLTPFLPLLKMAYDLKKGPEIGDQIDILLVEHRIAGKNPVAWAYYEQIQRGEEIPHYATGWILSPEDKQRVLETYFFIKRV